MEEGTLQFPNVDENWMYREEAGPVLGPTSELNERQIKLETRRDARKPLVDDRIIPFARHPMLTEPNGGVLSPGSFKHALECLAEGGSVREQQLASHALEMWGNQNTERAGREAATAATFSLEVKCADYIAQNVSFGALHFAALDMVGDGPLNLRLRQALGPANKQETTSASSNTWHLRWAGGRTARNSGYRPVLEWV